MKPVVKTYTLVVCVLAAVLTYLLWQQSPVEDWAPVAALMVLSFATENFAFELPLAGSVSLAFAMTYAALLFGGPIAAVLCAVAGSTTVQEAREHKPLVLRAFNAGQLALSAGLSGLAYLQLGGGTLAGGETVHIVPAVAAAVVFFVTNVSLFTIIVWMLQGRPIREILQAQGFISYGASLLILALLGATIAHLLALHSWPSLLLLVLPFVAARQTFRVSAQLSEAYLSTVRSLVETIEAKDPYTRGHSERVSHYAQQLGERLALSGAEMSVLERAALLHDLGKLGVQVETLTSHNKLDADEVQAIRRHPALGSELVSHVDFLSDVVPIVRHHHERFDGGGYPEGLMGERIPLLARILAVADTYDAMTSDRAYRPGMKLEEARAEIVRVAGTQLDPNVCAAMIEILNEHESQAVIA